MHLTKLSIVNATFYAYHGVEKAEKVLGGKYEIDVDIFYDATLAIQNDAITHAVNYQNVLFAISDIVLNENFNLIETLSGRILDELMKKFDIIEELTVRIRKCNAPIRQTIDFVEVENSSKRKK